MLGVFPCLFLCTRVAEEASLPSKGDDRETMLQTGDSFAASHPYAGKTVVLIHALPSAEGTRGVSGDFESQAVNRCHHQSISALAY